LEYVIALRTQGFQALRNLRRMRDRIEFAKSIGITFVFPDLNPIV